MRQISPHIYLLPLGPVNAYLVEDGDDLTLIDTGMPGSAKKLQLPKAPNRILLTHAHTDHAGSAAALQKQWNIPVWAHAEDARLVEQGIPGRTPMHLSPGAVNWLVYHLFVKNAAKTIEPVGIERTLRDGERLSNGLTVIHTPGHSAGHVAFLHEKDRVLIAGDICANPGSLNWSTVYEDRSLGKDSILKAAKYDFGTAVFGHGGVLKGQANKRLKEKFVRAKVGT